MKNIFKENFGTILLNIIKEKKKILKWSKIMCVRNKCLCLHSLKTNDLGNIFCSILVLKVYHIRFVILMRGEGADTNP